MEADWLRLIENAFCLRLARWMYSGDFYIFTSFKLCSTLSALPTRRTKQRRPGSGGDQLQLPAVRLPVLDGAQCGCHRGGAAAAALPAQPLHPPMLHSALHVLSTGAVSAAEAPGGGETNKMLERLSPLCLLGDLKKKKGGEGGWMSCICMFI